MCLSFFQQSSPHKIHLCEKLQFDYVSFISTVIAKPPLLEAIIGYVHEFIENYVKQKTSKASTTYIKKQVMIHGFDAPLKKLE